MKVLVAIHLPDNHGPQNEDAEMHRAIDELNDAMVAAGVRIFVGGLQPPHSAHTIATQADGNVLVSKGPFFAGETHVGGFWVLDVKDMEAALQWGRRATVACRAPVEVRAFNEPNP